MTIQSRSESSSNPSGCKFNIGDKVQYYSSFRKVFVQGIVCEPKYSDLPIPKGTTVVWAYWNGKGSKGYCYESEVTLVEPAKPDYNDEEWI